jgi:hypothetical protein
MTQEEIRKLLGGYAANTLTEHERKALFEAALDDQALFDVLQNEDALRELLADPVSREQIREVLKPTPRRRLWMQPWLIGTASVAVAALIAVAVVTRHREPTAPNLQTPQPAPAMPAPERKRAAGLVARSAVLAARPASDIANAPLYTGPLVRYAVLRSGPSGDAVHIQVVSQLAGNLTLYRMDAGGQWQRVFPASGPGLPIAANTSYQIPSNPIAISGGQDKLRLVIEPPAGSAVVVEIAIGPN